ncbi:MAG: hypothetical protein K5683_05120 [Prevotella sp.]|nr:hypothetical protein [Prevotella sp.]
MGKLNRPRVTEVCMGSEPTVAAMTQLIASEEYTNIFSDAGILARTLYYYIKDGGPCMDGAM